MRASLHRQGNEEEPMKYVKISECSNFWSWLFFQGDWRHHWEGPYVLWRESFWRICGFEFSSLYKQRD